MKKPNRDPKTAVLKVLREQADPLLVQYRTFAILWQTTAVIVEASLLAQVWRPSLHTFSEAKKLKLKLGELYEK